MSLTGARAQASCEVRWHDAAEARGATMRSNLRPILSALTALGMLALPGYGVLVGLDAIEPAQGAPSPVAEAPSPAAEKPPPPWANDFTARLEALALLQ